MQFSFYSCMMAIIASTAMIIVIYFLKKSKYFANTFGVWYMALLYLLSFVRLAVPFGFDKAQVIGERVVLPKLMDVLENRNVYTAHLPFSMLGILGSASFLVTFTLISIFTYRQLRFMSSLVNTRNFAKQEEKGLLDKISSEVFLKKPQITLIKTDDVTTPMVVGLMKSMVVIPNREYDSDELQLILYHECMHLKNHDLWLKLLVNIYCCVYWFNPFVYLLKADMDFILEVKCDTAVFRKLTEEKRLDYAKLVNDSVRSKVKGEKRFALITSSFASVSTSRHICTMNSLLNPNSKGPALPIAIVSLIMVVICLSSNAFVLKPDYQGLAEGGVQSYVVSDEDSTGGYLVPAKSGDYYLCLDDIRVLVNKEDVTKGYYDNYPIVYVNGTF